jgi:hypothetical protein
MRDTSTVPSSDDPLARAIESELRAIARVLARLVAHELRLLLTDSPEPPQSNGDGPACRVCGRPAQPGRHMCRRCRRAEGLESERERELRAARELREAEREAVRSGARGPRARELASGARRDPARPPVSF